MNWDNSLGPMGLLQAYRANPFSLQTDMSRPAQLLPQGLPQFQYAYQPQMQPQQSLMTSYNNPSGALWNGGDVDASQMGPADGGFTGADGSPGDGSGGK